VNSNTRRRSDGRVARPRYTNLLVLGVVGGPALGAVSAFAIALVSVMAEHNRHPETSLATGLSLSIFALIIGMMYGLAVGLTASLGAVGLTALTYQRFRMDRRWIPASIGAFTIVAALVATSIPLIWTVSIPLSFLAGVLPFVTAVAYGLVAAATPPASALSRPNP
jgi:hypothetical protein